MVASIIRGGDGRERKGVPRPESRMGVGEGKEILNCLRTFLPGFGAWLTGWRGRGVDSPGAQGVDRVAGPSSGSSFYYCTTNGILTPQTVGRRVQG